jgi:2-oxoglutarate dehydrogenase E1 component
MGHRGRLNVLANIMGKHPWQIFREFDDSIERLDGGRGDVKYHLGFHNEWKTAAGNEVYLALCFNPSHLEFVNPEALGRMRAHMDRVGDTKHERGLVLLIHGDASFAGEGIVQESLNLSRLPAYTVGGAIHVIINNQIGFTTGPEQSRSSIYASDVAKLLQSPIFHVNGEDPEAVAQVLNLALDFRGAFAQDVVIDMYCFRKHGHNEGDEPAFTQPLLYEAIRRRASVREEYLARLSESGGLTREEGEEIARRRRENLEAELRVAREPIPSGLPAAREGEKEPAPRPGGLWTGYEGGLEAGVAETPTTFDKGRLAEFLAGLAQLPEDFHLHPKLLRGLEQRRRMAREEIPVDWAAAEALAFATLASENRSVRLTGQDSERGTFSHRHAVLHDIKDGHTYTPLQHVTSGQAQIEISNSPLSEAAVLGFEYGYSVQAPDGLVIWEAQFGDFCNAAQVMVDQFIASGEEKWRRLSSLTLLLPHGFEGQGPEHSSARLERFLQLAAEDNIQVVFPTTPAQFFHLLRRQVWRSWRKPLIVLTPKSLLRHPQVVSPLKELAQGRFHPVLPDEAGVEAGSANGKKPASQSPPPFPAFRDPHAIKRILLCSGKIYYELLRQRQELGQADAALIRLEQLYPFPEMELAKVLEPYPDGTPAFWVQEEPENMGAWNYLREKVGPRLLGRMPLSHVARPASASPSTGSHTQHKREQTALLQRAFIGTAVEETMAHAH